MSVKRIMIEAVATGENWSDVLTQQDMEAAAGVVAAETGAHGDVALALGDDTLLQQLNRDFRGKDKPTNVLSFPSGEDDFLGDVAMSRETLRREAAEQDKDERSHALHLLVHGILHLLGYDHETDEQADVMESLERRVLEKLGIADPYGDQPQAH